MEITQFAPVLITTLNRHLHFKQCVKSLAATTQAQKTELFIAFDYPFKKEHWEGYNEMKNCINNLSGFKKITVFERKTNYGAEKNFYESVRNVFENHENLIFSEDDNIFSPDFLAFVNRGLQVYKDRKDIFSVSGYQFPIELPLGYKHDIYLWQGFSAWGVGIWRDKWEEVPRDLKALKFFLDQKQNRIALNSVAPHYLPGLKRIVETGHITEDTLVSFHHVANNLYSVFPVVSRVRNNGHDGSGLHGGNNKKTRSIYSNQSIFNGKTDAIFPAALMPSNLINKVLRQHFKPSIWRGIKLFSKSKIRHFIRFLGFKPRFLKKYKL